MNTEDELKNVIPEPVTTKVKTTIKATGCHAGIIHRKKVSHQR